MKEGVCSQTMSCDDVMHLVDLYLDGEIDDVERREIELHLESCPDCSAGEARRRHTREQLRAVACPCAPNMDFRSRLEDALRNAACSETSHEERPVAISQKLQAIGSSSASPGGRVWLLAAAGLLAVSGAGLFAAVSDPEPTQVAASQDDTAVFGMTSVRSPLVDEAVAWHGREVPLDVSGPSEQAVEEWFSSRVDFAVDAPELGEDATLLGGRLANVRQHEAAYLLYSVGGERLTVLLSDVDDTAQPTPMPADGHVLVDNRSGYTVVMSEASGVARTITSSIDEGALLSLIESDAPRGLATLP